MQIAIAIDDLAFVTADTIARPVNAELRAVTPVIRRLEEAAGAALQQRLQVQQPLEVGAAVVTAAGAVEAELMIHAVVSTDVEVGLFVYLVDGFNGLLTNVAVHPLWV